MSLLLSLKNHNYDKPGKLPNEGKDDHHARIYDRCRARLIAPSPPLIRSFMHSVRDGWVAQLMELPADEPIRAPIVGAYDGRICFENGRHRARAAMLQGLTIPVIVDRDNAAEVRELLARFKVPSSARSGPRCQPISKEPITWQSGLRP
jgi:hypothetical protein